MTTFRTLIAASILSSLPLGVVFAQAARMGIGGDPLSAEKAPNTTVVGQTKPPSRDASPTSVKPIDRVTPRQAADDAIANRVCVGCGGEPITTGALPPASSSGKSDARHDEVSTATEPKKQSDLDTVALASAHRERAESVREKTNGLWQSWTVSICDGCDDQQPYKRRRLEDWPVRNVPMTTGSIDKAPPVKRPHAEAKRSDIHPHGTLEADLSPENVDSIRRMPRQ